MRMNRNIVLQLYRIMLKIRLFEERIRDDYATGTVPGLVHLYIGEEAIAAGVCANLTKDDFITSTHRGHGHLIAKGGELRYMMAELYGKKSGYCKGKGGSMHIADVDLGILGANGIVGAGIPIALGAALSSQMRNTDQVTVCFFGDGATNHGTFHEGLNFAAVYVLPIVFICENNGYALSRPQEQQQRIKDISIRAAAYDMPGVTIDGNDVMAVYQTSGRAIQKARQGQGPTLIECKTYRWRGHHEGDANQGRRYRTLEEIKQWMEKCPIKRFEAALTDQGILNEDIIKTIKTDLGKEIDDAVKFALESSFPAAEDIYEDVYVQRFETAF
jgi:TPP-dependent pyruvate/acetoin dehydrogenase alpha subunit